MSLRIPSFCGVSVVHASRSVPAVLFTICNGGVSSVAFPDSSSETRVVRLSLVVIFVLDI